MKRTTLAGPAALLLAIACGAGWVSGCGSAKQAEQTPAPQAGSSQEGQPGEHRYHLAGTIVSIDKPQQRLVIDHKDIPGFMSAMTMPYPVVDAKVLDQVGPGDQITADVVATDKSVHLENVVVVKKGAGGKPATELQSPQNASPQAASQQNGEPVPDFMLVNQDGKHIGLRQYHGRAVLLTFIYTRCPLPDYCPLMTHNFAEIDKALAKNPQLYSDTHLLSISFDPKFDTPPVLRSYARSYVQDKGKQTFDHWEFAALPAAETKDVTKYFNIFLSEQGGQITHSMCTAIISPAGTLYRSYHGNDWKPDEVLADLATLLPPAGQAPAAVSR
jgi:protein SCO1/2